MTDWASRPKRSPRRCALRLAYLAILATAPGSGPQPVGLDESKMLSPVLQGQSDAASDVVGVLGTQGGPSGALVESRPGTPDERIAV